jgi:hypothetical protein
MSDTQEKASDGETWFYWKTRTLFVELALPKVGRLWLAYDRDNSRIGGLA